MYTVIAHAQLEILTDMNTYKNALARGNVNEYWQKYKSLVTKVHEFTVSVNEELN
jgi:hypothetical protein